MGRDHGSTSLPISTLRSLLISPEGPRDWRDQEPLAACLVSLGGKAPELLPELEAAFKASPAALLPYASARIYVLLGGDHARAARALMSYSEASAAGRTHPSPELTWLVSTSAVAAMLLIEWCDHPDPIRRTHAAEMLAYSAAPAVLPKLRELTRDPLPGVADTAKHAIKRIQWDIDHHQEAARLREERTPPWRPHRTPNPL